MGRDAAFHLFSRSFLLDNGGTSVQSAIIRHDFEPHELGPPRLNPSNKIQRTQNFQTSDVSMMSKAVRPDEPRCAAANPRRIGSAI